LAKFEVSLAKEKEVSEANRLTTDRQLHQLKVDREKLQTELDTFRNEQTSRLGSELKQLRE